MKPPTKLKWTLRHGIRRSDDGQWMIKPSKALGMWDILRRDEDRGWLDVSIAPTLEQSFRQVERQRAEEMKEIVSK